jgi:predicted ribosomally synthesized peptide with nif11-like leader
MDISEKVKELTADRDFMKSLGSMETLEEISAALHEKGFEITPDELEQSRQLAVASENGELDEASLNAVSGGSVGGIIVGGILIWNAVAAAIGVLTYLSGACGKRNRR